MAIRYEYNSPCCSHFYIETRNESDAQVITKCNVCGQGEYAETNRTEIKSIAAPVYVAEPVEPVDSATQKLLDAGLTQEGIDVLVAQVANPPVE